MWRVKIGAEVDTAGSYARDLGVEFEEPIAKVWAKRAGKFLARVDTLRHPTHPLAIATPDRAVYSARPPGNPRRLMTDVRDAERLLQVKSTNWRMRRMFGEPGTDGVPDEFLCQAHWEGSVAGVSLVEFAVDFDKTDLISFVVPVDHEFFGRLYDVVERFWIEHVERKIPPPPDASDRYAEHLRRWFPRHTTDDLLDVSGAEPLQPSGAAPEDVRAAVYRYQVAKAVVAAVEARMKLDRNLIVSAIGERAGLTWNDADGLVAVTYKATKERTVVDWQALAQAALTTAGLAVAALPAGDLRTELELQIRGAVAAHTTRAPGFRQLRYAKAPAAWREPDVAALRLAAVNDADEIEPAAATSNVSPL